MHHMQYDFIAIGDITTDAFITLKDAHVTCDIDTEKCQLCVRFGDKIPYESVTIVKAVGNSPNAAVAAHRVGLATGLITNLGDDRNGEECIESLTQEGLSTEFVTVHPGIPTNYHYVLRYDAERTILIKHEVYPYTFPQLSGTPRWLYLSSLGDTSLSFHSEIAAYLTANPTVKLAFQPGTFQMSLGTEKLRDIYAHTELFVCNKQEAQRILGHDSDDIKALCAGLHALGPKQLLITNGPQGGYASDGTQIWFVPMYPDPAPPVDRTGAGDATASTTAAYLAQGLPLQDAFMRGIINAMSVVQYIGAQAGLLTNAQIEEYVANAPDDFKPTLVV